MLRTSIWVAFLLGSVLLAARSIPAAEKAARPNEADAGVDMMAVERFDEGDAGRGEELFLQYCRGCHGKDGRGGAHTFMPHVGNLTKKDYVELLPDGYLYTIIAEGGAALGKSSYMPAWKSKLSEDDIKDIVAHIRTLPTY